MPALFLLFLFEGQAIGALILGGVSLMGTNHDPLQRAVVCLIAMVGALSYGAFNALVCMAIHSPFLLLI